MLAFRYSLLSFNFISNGRTANNTPSIRRIRIQRHARDIRRADQLMQIWVEGELRSSNLSCNVLSNFTEQSP